MKSGGKFLAALQLLKKFLLSPLKKPLSLFLAPCITVPRRAEEDEEGAKCARCRIVSMPRLVYVCVLRVCLRCRDLNVCCSSMLVGYDVQ